MQQEGEDYACHSAEQRHGQQQAHRGNPAVKSVEKAVDKVKDDPRQIPSREQHGIIQPFADKSCGEERPTDGFGEKDAEKQRRKQKQICLEPPHAHAFSELSELLCAHALCRVGAEGLNGVLINGSGEGIQLQRHGVSGGGTPGNTVDQRGNEEGRTVHGELLRHGGDGIGQRGFHKRQIERKAVFGERKLLVAAPNFEHIKNVRYQSREYRGKGNSRHARLEDRDGQKVSGQIENRGENGHFQRISAHAQRIADVNAGGAENDQRKTGNIEEIINFCLRIDVRINLQKSEDRVGKDQTESAAENHGGNQEKKVAADGVLHADEIFGTEQPCHENGESGGIAPESAGEKVHEGGSGADGGDAAVTEKFSRNHGVQQVVGLRQ